MFYCVKISPQISPHVSLGLSLPTYLFPLCVFFFFSSFSSIRYPFHPKIGSKDKPYIALAGDGTNSAFLLTPTDQPFGYSVSVLLNAGGTVGAMAVADVNGDGYTVPISSWSLMCLMHPHLTSIERPH